MKAIDILMEEHRVIERVIAALETAVNHLRSDETISHTVFLQAADFIKGFADGCHHKKEEGVLFPAMQAAGVPGEDGPIGVMLAEHEEGRRLTSGMRAAAERLAKGDAAARAELARLTLDYVTLLRQHIDKEDNVLFPMAEQVLQGAAQAEVSKAIERVAHEEISEGMHEKFLELAASIEKQVAGWG